MAHDDQNGDVAFQGGENINDGNFPQQNILPEDNRRSTRVSRPPSDWWKAQSTAYALTARKIPQSYKDATSGENIDFWQPGTDREHECFVRNNTWK